MNEARKRQRSEVLVIALVGKDLAPVWWASQNRAFGQLTPNDQWSVDCDVVYQYLMNHHEGTW